MTILTLTKNCAEGAGCTVVASSSSLDKLGALGFAVLVVAANAAAAAVADLRRTSARLRFRRAAAAAAAYARLVSLERQANSWGKVGDWRRQIESSCWGDGDAMVLVVEWVSVLKKGYRNDPMTLYATRKSERGEGAHQVKRGTLSNSP